MSFCGMRGTVPCSVAAGRGAECTLLKDLVPGLTAGRAPTTLLRGALCLLCRKESQPGPHVASWKPDIATMCAVAAAFVLTPFHEARDRVANSRGPRNVNSVLWVRFLQSHVPISGQPGAGDEIVE